MEPESFSVIGVKAAVAHRRAYDRIAAASYTVENPRTLHQRSARPALSEAPTPDLSPRSHLRPCRSACRTARKSADQFLNGRMRHVEEDAFIEPSRNHRGDVYDLSRRSLLRLGLTGRRDASRPVLRESRRRPRRNSRSGRHPDDRGRRRPDRPRSHHGHGVLVLRFHSG